MSNFKTKYRKGIEKMVEIYGTDPTDLVRSVGYKECAEDLFPVIEEMRKALEFYKEAGHGEKADQALKNLKEFLEKGEHGL